MTAIGPNFPSLPQGSPQPADAAAKAQMARALFFQAMTNPSASVAAPAPPPAATAARPQTPASPPVAQASEDAQPRLRRPGSLLNILV